MSKNSSNDSLPFSHLLETYCYVTRPSSFIYTAYIITYIALLLPLCIFIIYHGLQWRKKRSASSAAPMSHSDSFTYHLVAMEMIRVFGYIISCWSMYDNNLNPLVGHLFSSLTWYGEIFFHLLTCVERYLAVVHPVTYLSLRKERGVRIRNITIGCVWLLCFTETSLAIIEHFIIVDACLFILSLTIVSFCSLSVLRVLIRPGPGEQGGVRERVDQSKLRAFYTILVILGVLVIQLAGNLTWAVMTVSKSGDCVTKTCLFWLSLPSSLVLPLLFLHREGKLVCWKKNIQ